MAQGKSFAIDAGLFSFRPRTVDLPGAATIHDVDEGDGPLLLLLHGNAAWSLRYREIIRKLRDRLRCSAPDDTGFGLSEAPKGCGHTAEEHANVMLELVFALDLRDPSVVMQGRGGPIGFSVAVRSLDRVVGFILGHTWAWPLERAGQKLFSRIFGGPIGRLLAWSCNGIVHLFSWRGVVTGHLTVQMVRRCAHLSERQVKGLIDGQSDDNQPGA